MTDYKQVTQFYTAAAKAIETAEKSGADKAAALLDAATGVFDQVEEYAPYIVSFAIENEIDITGKLANLQSITAAAKVQAHKEKAVGAATEAVNLLLNIAPEYKKNLETGHAPDEKEMSAAAEKMVKAMAALAALNTEAVVSLGTAERGKRRFYTANDYLNECRNYDPSKDFTPSMLAGLRFPNSTLSYIGARPGGGKSMILVNLAREAITAHRKVYFVNLEMPYRDIATNYSLSLMYATANKEQREELKAVKDPMNKYYSLFKREYDSRETFDFLRKNAINEMTGQLEKELFLFGIGETLETLIDEIEGTANYGDVVLVDYLQRVPPPKGYNDRYIQIKHISNALLALALKKGMVILSGAQFGRQVKNNANKEATLEDFKEGGDIEQDAHNALAIETIIETITDKEGRYVHVLKQRRGGAKYKRALIDCSFEYLYMAGTGKEYTPDKETKKKPPSPGNDAPKNTETKKYGMNNG